jgi:hypothetical protein
VNVSVNVVLLEADESTGWQPRSYLDCEFRNERRIFPLLLFLFAGGLIQVA